MSVLFGLYQPEAGFIRDRGREVRVANPNVAGELGIGMVHQHFKLVHNFTVTENIVLGMEPSAGPVLTLRKASERIQALSKQYGLDVDPHAKIEDVSVGMQQRVEILKMLYRDTDILIFDEPTAVLTPQEIQDLMKIMKNLQNEGKSIILITHKLKEIKAIADRCTVIRRGKVVGTLTVAEASEEKMAEMMVGRQVSFHVDKGPFRPGEAVLKIEGLSVRSSRRLPAVRDFSLEVRAGEIVGVAGVEGNGQTELVEALTGLRGADSGRVEIKGIDVTKATVRQRFEAGVAHIPEDRQKRGLVLDYTLAENFVLENHCDPPYSKSGLLNKEAIDTQAERLIVAFDVRSGEGARSKARGLSGGNQQKAIVGREIDHNPDLLIAVQPTRGLDVGSIEYIHKRLIEQRDRGKAVLLVSLELDEILDLSDRIAVMSRGELVGVVDGGTDENRIGLMMAGVKSGANA
jgi:simple sugar transport system ATP-binding protein